MSRAVRTQLVMGAFCGVLPYLVCVSAASAQQTGPGTAALEIVNRASVAISEVRLASRAMSAWGSNLLKTPVEPREQRRVVPERQEGCLYAIRVVYKDNRFERFGVIDLCRNNEYVFVAKNAQQIANQSTYSAPPASEVSIFNRSSKTVSFIRMSAVNNRMWGPDRLGNRTLGPGQSFNVPLDDNQGCFYRIRAFYDDNLTEIISSANLCDDSNVEFKRTAAITTDQVPSNMRLDTTNAILLSNQSGLQIDSIYVFPRNDRDRGRDRLGRNYLPAGRQTRVEVGDLSLCFVTILAVYQDRREEWLQGLDLCAAPEPSWTLRGPSGAPNPQLNPPQNNSQGLPSRP